MLQIESFLVFILVFIYVSKIGTSFLEAITKDVSLDICILNGGYEYESSANKERSIWFIKRA